MKVGSEDRPRKIADGERDVQSGSGDSWGAGKRKIEDEDEDEKRGGRVL